MFTRDSERIRVIEHEGLVEVTGSHVHCECGISEMVQNREVT